MFCETLTPETIELLPLAVFEGSIFEISDLEEVNQALDYLEQQSVIGFDTETKPCFVSRPGGRCKPDLLQLATKEQAFLFHLLKVGVTPRMASLLGNSQILKVGAAVRDDIKGLQMYRKFTAMGFVDLQHVAEEYGIKDKSLRKIAANILKLRISKGQQLSNWQNPKLTRAQQQYAAIDAWACHQMYYKLKL